MSHLRLLLFSTILLASVHLYGRGLRPNMVNPALSITGTVIDSESRQPISDCHVYISGTTFGAITDDSGHFKIEGLELGRHTLVVSHVSYELLPIDITLIDKDADLGKIKMKIRVQEVFEVEVSDKKDPDWKRNARRFKKSVFGEFYEEAKIQIPNDYNINYRYPDLPVKLGENEIKYKGMRYGNYDVIQKGKGISIEEPFDLEIQNEHTGYILNYVVMDYYVGLQTEDYILGFMRFEEMVPDSDAQEKQWALNREKAYYGSLTHFLKSLVKGDFVNEGYEVRVTSLSPWDAKKRRLIKRAKVDTLSGTNVPSRFAVTDTEFENIKRIEFDDFLEFEFWNEADKKGGPQKSWIKLRDKAILVYENGVLVDPTSMYLFGYLISEGLYEILPFDYTPKH